MALQSNSPSASHITEKQGRVLDAQGWANLNRRTGPDQSARITRIGTHARWEEHTLTILLASFILMRQSRLVRRGDERDHLMLQILLLTEKETTAVLSLNRQIAKEMGLEKIADNPEMRELSSKTSIEDVAQTIKEALPPVE